jgi:hypothetical protein
MECKTCYACQASKPLDGFPNHKEMRDGKLNICRPCNAAAQKARRHKAGAKEERRARYERELELGSRTRKRAIKVNGVFLGPDPEAHRVSALIYAHKKRAAHVGPVDELTDICMKEAASLVRLRTEATGIKWTIDHIVPLGHKEACGLHVAANIQVVPATWNFQKGRSNMQSFWN